MKNIPSVELNVDPVPVVSDEPDPDPYSVLSDVSIASDASV